MHIHTYTYQTHTDTTHRHNTQTNVHIASTQAPTDITQYIGLQHNCTHTQHKPPTFQNTKTAVTQAHAHEMQRLDSTFAVHYRRKSNRGIETLPSSSGPLRCLLESGEPLAFWFRTPKRERLSMDSNGRRATAIGKLILE